MIKKHFLILVITTIIISNFVLSNNIANATQVISVTRVCHNGPNNNDSGGCGTPCMALCRDTSFVPQGVRSLCEDITRRTDSWTKYNVILSRAPDTTRSEMPGAPVRFIYHLQVVQYGRPIPHWGIPVMDAPEIRIAGTSIAGTLSTGIFTTGMSTASTPAIDIAAVCSTADKCDSNTCANPRSPFLRAGRCDCSVGGRYKICCRREGNRYVETMAMRAEGQQDGHPPEEGMCPGGWIAPPNVTRCPAPIPTPAAPIPAPEFGIDSFSANPIRIAPGQSTTLTWTTTGATNCNITRTGPGGERGGLGDVPVDGSGTSNPQTIGEHTYTLACRQEGAATNTLTRSATITVAPAAQRWWFCMNNACQQTTEQYTTAAACQAAVRIWHRIDATCHRTRSECEQGCAVPPPPPPPPPPLLGCVVSPSSPVSSNIRAERACLPFHATRGRDINPVPITEMTTSTNITWSGNANNVCADIISGGSPDNSNISCINVTPNWMLNRSGSSSLSGRAGPFTPTTTQSYEIRCDRESFRCSDSRTFSTGTTEENRNACEASCADLRNRFPNTLANCSCGQGSCVEHWSAATDPHSEHCVLWSSCQEESTCTRTIIDPITRLPRTESYPCIITVSCPPCLAYACRRFAYDQSVQSRPICPSSTTASQQVRVIQKPTTDAESLRTDPVRPQILLHQFINLVWSIDRPDSGVPTTLRCAPSVERGDGEGWTRGAGIPSILLDSLNPSGRRNNLSPNVTTRYQLFCRNRDAIDSNHCFRDSDIVSREVKVFTPDLREIPAFYNGFMRLVGRIGGVLR